MNKPNDYPKIVYKFRNWTDQFHKDVLQKNQLFLTSPKYFNDPFDCRIPKDFLSLNSIEKIEMYVDSFLNRHASRMSQLNKNIEIERRKLYSELVHNLKNYHEDRANIFFSNQDRYYGILSLSTKWDSILMWSHYADYHKGVCYGFWEEKLRVSKLFGEGGPVVYDPKNEYPSISPLNEDIMITGFIETHTKGLEWEYENEYRLLSILFPETESDKPPTDIDRIREIPDDFFTEIILGISIPETHRNEIIKIALQKNIKVYQAKKVSQRFEISREEIL